MAGYKILVMGLPGSGKSMLSYNLTTKLDADWFNADKIREKYNDWDFSKEGRIRQAHRMKLLAESSPKQFIICDFVCPLEEMRNIYNPDFIVWLNTIQESRFENTNAIFEEPNNFDIEVTTQDAGLWSIQIIRKMILKNL